jgi:hypothetical protein
MVNLIKIIISKAQATQSSYWNMQAGALSSKSRNFLKILISTLQDRCSEIYQMP